MEKQKGTFENVLLYPCKIASCLSTLILLLAFFLTFLTATFLLCATTTCTIILYSNDNYSLVMPLLLKS